MDLGHIGVFLCSCGKTLNIDLKKLGKELEKIDEVAVVERVESLCTEEGLAYIIDDLRRKELDRIVIGACTSKNKVFQDVAEGMELDPTAVDLVNIREECAWVHEDKKAATQKARFLIKSAIKNEPKLPEIVEVKAKPSILIAGDTRALSLADDFSDMNIEMHVLSEDPYFNRIPLESKGYQPSNKGSVYEFQDAQFHLNSKILDIEGDLGDFTVNILNGRYVDVIKCVDCGKCVEVCEPKAIERPADSAFSAYIIKDSCTECGECVKVCPTEAITLHPDSETVNAGQIISFYPVKPREGVFVIDEKRSGSSAWSAALQTAINIKGYKKEKFIHTDIKKCANHHIMEKKLDFKGCTFCEDSCAYFNVSSGVMSDLACKGCGSCATSCPQNTYLLHHQSFDDVLSEIDLTAEADINPRIVMFVCGEGGYSTLKAAGLNRLKYPPAIPLLVPCLGNVSELHVLRAFELGAEGVVLLGCGTDKCMYEKGSSRGSDSIALARSVLDSFGIEKERARIISGDGTEPEKFVRQLKDFEDRIKKLSKNPLSKKKPASLDFDKNENKKRVMLHSLISGFSKKTGVTEGRIETHMPVGILNVNEKECTLCGSCAFHCNAGALRHEGKEILDIYSTHTYCMACSICERICPEDAITIDRAIDIKGFVEKQERKFDVKIINCSECGRPLMAEAALNKLKKRLKEKELDMLQKCQGCLDRGTVADILRADPKSEDFIIIQQGKAPWEK